MLTSRSTIHLRSDDDLARFGSDDDEEVDEDKVRACRLEQPHSALADVVCDNTDAIARLQAFTKEDERKWRGLIKPARASTAHSTAAQHLDSDSDGGSVDGSGSDEVSNSDGTGDEVSVDNDSEDADDMGTGARSRTVATRAAGPTGERTGRPATGGKGVPVADTESASDEGGASDGSGASDSGSDAGEASATDSDDDSAESEGDSDGGELTFLDVFDAKEEIDAATAKAAHPASNKGDKANKHKDKRGGGADGTDDELREGEGITPEEHATLMELMANMHPGASAAAVAAKERPAKRIRLAETGVTEPDNEYAAVASGAGATGTTNGAGGAAPALTIAELMQPLARSSGFGELKTQMQRLVGDSEGAAGRKRKRAGAGAAGPLVAPPSGAAQARANRTEAYGEVKQHVSRWSELVAINRRAPHVSFSAEAQGAVGDRASGVCASGLAATFAPASEFEAVVAEILSGSGVAALPRSATAGSRGGGTGDAAVVAAERAELDQLMLAAAVAAASAGDGDEGMAHNADDLPAATVDPAVLRARQSQLAKMRALLFYDELKRKRQNKIKSKAYRKLKSRYVCARMLVVLERVVCLVLCVGTSVHCCV